MRRKLSGFWPNLGAALIVAALLAACSGSGTDPSPKGRLKRPAFTEDEYGVSTSPRLSDRSGRMPKGGGTFKLGSPYKVAGRWYVPAEEPGYDRTGIGSWYGDDFHGRKTANGEIFDMHALTAAHPTLPMPCYAYVTNLQNGRTILVRINDRGPYVRDRIIDLSHASARALGYEGSGRAHIRVRYAGRAPLNGDDRRERQYLAAQPWNGGRGSTVAMSEYSPLSERNLAPGVRSSRDWSATDYRASLAGKPLPRAFATHAPANGRDRGGYEVTSADLPPVDPGPRRASRPGDGEGLVGPRPYPQGAGASGGRLVWQPSPPSQPYTTSAVTAPGRRAGLGGDASLAAATAAYVQIGTFRDLSRAELFRGQFAHLGAVEVAALPGGADPLYRVRIGPMSEASARAALSEVNARGVAGGRVVFE